MVRFTAKRSQPAPADAHFLAQDMMKVKDFSVEDDGLTDIMDNIPPGSTPGDVLGSERPGEAPMKLPERPRREGQGGMVKLTDFGVGYDGLAEDKGANDDNFFVKSVMLTLEDISYFANQVHHPRGNPEANLKSISHRCHPILVAFVWELTKETIYLPLGCLQGGLRLGW